ncbi:S41 family peptidase [Membranihabitans marinus]|uniref:S41 family peptidase n=1 Tax=Membranihabitans marinus TaxID=1227546 RepID=UPI001F184B27|nr:S41 family peptidase [Membranihabitans marinus]
MKALRNILLLTFCLFPWFSFLQVTSGNNKTFEIAKNLEIFVEVYKNLNNHYVDDLDPATIMNVGLDAIMKSLDPYTRFYSESEIESYRFQTEGKYDGIGARIAKIEDAVTVLETYEGGPAVAAGLRAGDQIVTIDGISLLNKSNEEVKDVLLGTGGAEVVLGVKRYGDSEVQSIPVKKGEVNVKNVPYSGMIDDEYGYIALSTFTEQAGSNVRGALLELINNNKGLKGLIFDLRGNGGGYLREAVEVSNVFLPKGQLIASTKGKVLEEQKSYKTMKDAVSEELPVIVLIDGNSASASEIVSGSLQDYDRAVLLGERTYGKGLVQITKNLPYNNRMKLTTSKYYIPSGRCIQSVEYDADGEPIVIADSLRTTFKTSNGRVVLDGGGVKPDVELSSDINPEILQHLRQKYLIFNYANEYYLHHPEIGNVEEFEYEDYQDWLKFIESKGFNYQSKAQSALDELKNNVSDYKKFEKEIKAISNQLAKEKESSLEEHQQVIQQEIGKEIASRYYLQKGKILYALRHDPQITKAIEVMKDQKRYNEILAKGN